MLKLSKYLKKYKVYTILAPLLMILEVACELAQPKLVSNIINIGIADKDIKYIINTGIIMFVISLLGIVGGIGCLIFSSLASQNFGADVREDMFVKIQKFSFSNIDKFNTSSLITRLTNDVTQVQNVVLMSLRMLVRAPFLAVGGMFMAFSISPKLTGIIIATAPAVAVSILVLVKTSFPFFSVVQAKLDKVNMVMRENLSGVRVVKVFVRGDYEKKKFNEANEDYRDTTIKAFQKIILLMPIMFFIINFAIVCVLYVGGIQVNQGNMPVGDVVAILTYLMQIFTALMMVSMVFMIFSRAKVSADRINEVLETEVDIVDPLNSVKAEDGEGCLEFKNVYFKYGTGDGEYVLENINFTAKKGETVAILGETGSGKSTLINLIPRLYDTAQGEILINGENIKNLKLKDLREKISVVLQESILFSGTIKENIKWGKKTATDEEIETAAKSACAHEFIESFPEKYETMLGQKGVNLSGGQKQRISIARSLIKKPEILILDDSTSAVDVVTEKKIQKALAENLKDTTKIIIAQRISSVINADKIIVIGKGTIAAIGKHNDLLKSSKDYREIYNSQIGKGVKENE